MTWLIAVVILCLVSFNDAVKFTDCGSAVGNFTKVTVSNCDVTKPECILKRGTDATIEIDFMIEENASDLKSVVHGTVLGVPIPFPIPEPDACADANSGIACPLAKDGKFTFKATLPIQRNYPKVNVQVKWELQDENNKDVVCVKIPAKIQ